MYHLKCNKQNKDNNPIEKTMIKDGEYMIVHGIEECIFTGNTITIGGVSPD